MTTKKLYALNFSSVSVKLGIKKLQERGLISIYTSKDQYRRLKLTERGVEWIKHNYDREEVDELLKPLQDDEYDLPF